MCFASDSRPPPLPADVLHAPVAGGAGSESLELTSADGTRFSAALAEAAGDATSAVAILPDVRGLHPFYSELVERFAQGGHHAIAIDYFGRTAGLLPRDASFDFVAHVQQTKVAQVQADTLAAAAALRERTGASKIATVGFCFGGLHSFLAGADLGREVTGVVGFHGVLRGERFGISGPIDHAGQISRPLLGLFGGAYQTVPTDDVREFESRLTGSEIEHEVRIYPGAPHSFFDRHYYEHAAACDDAWRRTLRFLERHAG